MEEWRDIKGYEGIYQISNYGRVKSLIGAYGKHRELIMKQNYCHNGYKIITLCKEGKKRTHKVHRLVAEAFLNNPDNLPQINHKDEHKDNNFVENLEWCSNIYNMNYGTRNKRASDTMKGYNNRSSKQVKCITTNEIFGSMREAERKTGISRSSISKSCKTGEVINNFKWVFVKGGDA